MSLLIFAEAPSPRLVYIAELLFGQLSGIPVRVTGNREQFDTYEGPKLNYSLQPFKGKALWLAPCGLLAETGIRPQACDFFMASGVPALFPTPVNGAHFSFDVFAASFFMVSRYEEYLPAKRDEHDRFPSTSSIAGQKGFLQRPVVNEWARLLAQALKNSYPALNIPAKPYVFQPTYDIDIAWAYGHRPWWRTIGAIGAEALRGNRGILRNRIAVWRGKADDPYFTFPYLDGLHQKYGLNPLFFFLLGNPGNYDRNISAGNPEFRKLIAQLAATYPVGIHPSYAASTNPERLETEISRLADITGKPVTRSRQHYLRLRFPDTYRQLLNSGIQEDHTLGYADQSGFRAGMAGPFYWYDLEREEATTLQLHPFQVMEVTLRQYQGIAPSAAGPTIDQLVFRVRETGGTFTTLWHNSSFSALHGWEGWSEVYENMLENSR